MLLGSGRVRRVLVGTVDLRVDRDDPADQTGGIGVSQKGLQDPVPGPVDGAATVAFTHHLPGAEVFGQVTPGNPSPVAVDHPFEDLTGVPERATPLPSLDDRRGSMRAHWPSVSCW